MDRPIAYDKLAREDRFVRMRAREVRDLRVEQGLAPFGRFDKLLLDPPREGAIEIVKALPHDWPRRIVYVACDPDGVGQ